MSVSPDRIIKSIRQLKEKRPSGWERMVKGLIRKLEDQHSFYMPPEDHPWDEMVGRKQMSHIWHINEIQRNQKLL